MTTVQHYIHGELREELRKEATMPLYNPATGQEIGSVPIASDETRRDVLASATAGAAVWAASSLSQRSAVLFKFRELLAQSTDELAALITREQGKTLADARGELARGLENVEYACGIPTLLFGDSLRNLARGEAYQQDAPTLYDIDERTAVDPELVERSDKCVLVKPGRLAQLVRSAGFFVEDVAHGTAPILTDRSRLDS